jgi:hypothetical protein
MKHIGRRLCALAAALLCLTGPRALAAEHFHAAYLSGFPDGTVRPCQAATREQAAQMLYCLLKPDARQTLAESRTAFFDVPPARWSYAAVSAMCELGVMPGRGDGGWAPEDELTGRELAQILNRLMGLSGAKEAFPEENTQLQLIPDGPVTRAALAASLNRLFDRTPAGADALVSGGPDWPDNRDASAWYYLDIQEASADHTCEIANGAERWTGLG